MIKQQIINHSATTLPLSHPFMLLAITSFINTSNHNKLLKNLRNENQMKYTKSQHIHSKFTLYMIGIIPSAHTVIKRF